MTSSNAHGVTQLGDAAFAQFHQQNADFDILKFDFCHQKSIQALDFSGLDRAATLSALAAYQRLLRVFPNEEIAHRLIEAGFDSAHAIASRSQKRFVQESASVFGGDVATARTVHRTALTVKNQVSHLWANVWGLVGSPHYRATRFQNTSLDSINYMESLPSYQDLFGSLNYLECPHCRSIFSASAYFVDLMRVTQEYITFPNTKRALDNIPPGMRLDERRPDLFDLKLTCEETDTVVPFLKIVNQVLEDKIEADTKSSPFHLLALSHYPFNLPFQLPLAQIRIYLSALKVSLAQVYADFLGPLNSGKPVAGTADSLTLAASASGRTGEYAGMNVRVRPEKGAWQTRRITAYDGTSRIAGVAPAFSPVPDASWNYEIVDTMDEARERLALSPEQFSYLTTSDPSATEVSRAYGYTDIESVLYAFQAAPGAITFSRGSVDVTGDAAARFDQYLSPGSQLLCNGEIRSVMRVISATSLKVTAPWEKDATNAGYQATHWAAGAGTVSFTKDSRLLTGNGTQFKKLAVGDAIQSEQAVRTIIEIASDTALTVDAAWGADATGAAFTFSPTAMLERVLTFSARTGLSRDQIIALLTQDLSPAEQSRQAGAVFFINDTQEGLPPLALEQTSTDPNNPYERIVGLSLRRLDRISRFTRLQAALGWSFADVDWQLSAAGGGITAASLGAIADAMSLVSSTGLDPDRVAAFWGEIKTIGQVHDVQRQDLFDRIYNDPALLRGKNPYGNNPTPVPFDWEHPLDWNVDERTAGSQDATIRSRMLGALSITDDELTALAGFLIALLEKKGTTPKRSLTLNLATLSWFYRITQQARAFGSSLQDFLIVLRLCYFPAEPQPPFESVPADVASALRNQRTCAWIKTSGLDAPKLLYIITGDKAPNLKPGYTDRDLRRLINDAAAASKDALIKPSMFVSGGIYEEQAKAIFKYLLAQEILTATGVVSAKAFTFSSTAPAFPVGEDAFISPNITEEESRQAFSELAGQATPILIVATGKKFGTLSENFSESTPLDFLFKDEPDAALKRAEVQSVLLRTRADIDNTLLVLQQAKTVQEANAMQAVASFIDVSQDTLAPVLQFTLGVDSLDMYRADLLTPLPAASPVPDSVELLIKTLSRAVVWIDAWRFTAAEITAIRANPRPFGIASTKALTLSNLESLLRFKMLTGQFNDSTGALLQYLSAGDTLQLARLTGWNPEQLTALITNFWPPAAGDPYPGGPATVDGVSRLSLSFDLSSQTGLDIYFMLGLCRLIHLSLEKIDGTFDDAAWQAYERQSDDVLSAVSAIYGATEFSTVAVDLTKQVDTLKRDALVDYTIWLLQQRFSFIRNTSDLYQFLLLDVEMSACAVTSSMVQAIASVQLYMQRARMNLEAGVTDVDIDPVWWEWMTAYRVWEANRKIFLYPENYLMPTLRTGQTPLFEQMAQSLQQTDLSDGSVSEVFLQYFKGFESISNVDYTGSYNTVVHRSSGDREVLFMVAQTGIDPYLYQYRTHDVQEGWSAWQQINLSINSPYVSAAMSFGRLFIFWSELDTNNSASIQTSNSINQLIVDATIKYSFLGVNGQWIQPQILAAQIPVDIAPDDYAPLKNERIKEILDTRSLSWLQPYPLPISRGIPGTGRAGVTANLGNLTGHGTLFKKEVRAGDTIYCAGEKRVVELVVSDTELFVNPEWTITAKQAEYKVMPANPQATSFPPFPGTGTVVVTAKLTNVSGQGTKFRTEINVGDKILVETELRQVVFVQSDTNLLVNSPWHETYSGKTYTIIPGQNDGEQLIVTYGGPLATELVVPFDRPTPDLNPGRDTFIDQRDRFNFSLYYALDMARNARDSEPPLVGTATVSYSAVIDQDLNVKPSRLLMLDYPYSATDAPRPFRAILDHTTSVLKVAQSENAIYDNNWGNNVSGTVSFPPGPGDAASLLYNISSTHGKLFNVGNQIGWFIFNNGDESFLVRAVEPGLGRLSDMIYAREMESIEPDRQNVVLSAGAYTTNPIVFANTDFEFTRISTNTVGRLYQKLLAGGIDNLLTISAQKTPELPFFRFYPVPTAKPAHVIPPRTDMLDFDGAYGIYFQEVFLFVPWLVADRLHANQQFDQAKRWYQYVFNPTAPSELEDEHAADRFWRYLPFRDMHLQRLSEILRDPRQITAYNDHPFDPDAIARLRPGAYAKAVVLNYILNLIDWGDSLFARDTRESIDQATQIYVMAAELLGQRPQIVGECPAPKPLTFREILAKYGEDIPQFLIDMENSAILPQAPAVDYRDVPFNDVNSYFCVPENSDLLQYWDRLEDRLFKIRNCMNLQGVVRQLPLFEPPIDPRNLVLGKGASGAFPPGSAAAGSIPYYRFTYMIEKAKSLASMVVQFGGEFLSAIEKRDAEQLALLRNSQEKALLRMTTQVKQQQVQEAMDTAQSLQENLASAKLRKKHYSDLLDVGLSQDEHDNLNSMRSSLTYSILSSVATTAASIGYAVPQAGSPFAMTYGGAQIGAALQASAGVFQIGSMMDTFDAQNSLTMAGYGRRTQDWTLQKNLAESDEKQITAQIAANAARIKIAQADLETHLETIRQNQATNEFMTRKFTSAQLYDWMVARLAEVYFQTYLLAFDLARSAQRSLQFESGQDRVFLDFTYWDSLRKGLLAGEGLTLSLSQMEKAFIDGSARAMEVERTISLLQLDPKALLSLASTGSCIFTLPEKLFDTDYPGQYRRLIKTISVSIPAVFGPYQNVKAVLTQMGNQVLVSPEIQGVEYLLGTSKDVPQPDVLRSNWWINQEVSLSRGTRDSGLFEVNLADARYLPFEGTGAVSAWRLSMPAAANRFSFSSISDVIIELKYTALNGGGGFRKQVTQLPAISEYSGSPLLNFNQQYSQEWFVFLRNHAVSGSQALTFRIAPSMVPPHVHDAKLVGFFFQLITADGISGQSKDSYISFAVTGADSVDFGLNPQNTYSHTFAKPIDMADVFAGDRTINFSLGKTPPKLKGTDGYLDPAAIRNIGVVLYYQGTLDW